MVTLEWLVLACGLAVVVVLAIQLAIVRPNGFVSRTSWSLAALLVLFGIVAAVLWLAGALS